MQSRNEPTKINGRHVKEYRLWCGIVNRCLNEKQQAYNPTYKVCEVSENFKDYNLFAKWCRVQLGFDREGWQLDKDILVKGNKLYSEDTCCFVPKDINVIFTHKRTDKGIYPTGVSFKPRLNKYVAQISEHKIVKHLGCFLTPEDAFQAYKVSKESYVKTTANRWKDQIDNRVYEALMKWEIDIND